MLERTDETVTLCHGHSSRKAQVDLEQTCQTTYLEDVKSMEIKFGYTEAKFIYD